MAVNRTVTATEFKAKCLAMLDEVAEQGGTITVTKRGKPVAEIRPAHRKRSRPKSLRDSWAGKIEIVGDIINLDDCESWQWFLPPLENTKE